jgi:hypothetical protein
MEKMNFSISIDAPKERVWRTLWNEDSYRKWTAVFSEGSTVETDNWKEGSKVLFLDSKRNGMVSKVAANRPNEYMLFEHLGEVKDGVEDTTSEKVSSWSGARESYTLTSTANGTDLKVDMDVTEEFKDYFLKTFPQALDKVKELAEAKAYA